MKLLILTITLILCLISTTFAYDYIIDSGYTPGLTLQNSKTLLMTGGGLGSLTLYDHTAATIQGTSALSQGIGGAWEVSLAGYSHLDLSGGQVHVLTLGSYSTATLSGGLIEQIHSYQLAWQWDYDVEPPVLVPDPHIEIICRDWNWYESTNILTGTWADYSTFDIQLCDHAPYDPVIDNIKFTIVPEPFSLLLLSAAGTILARRRH